MIDGLWSDRSHRTVKKEPRAIGVELVNDEQCVVRSDDAVAAGVQRHGGIVQFPRSARSERKIGLDLGRLTGSRSMEQILLVPSPQNNLKIALRAVSFRRNQHS